MTENEILELYPDSPRRIKISGHIKDIGFDEIASELNYMSKSIQELENLNYRSALRNKKTVKYIDFERSKVIKILEEISKFAISVPVPKNEQRKEYFDKIHSYYSNEFYDQIEPTLNLLKSQELASELKKEIEKQKIDAKRIKDELESQKLSIGSTSLSIDFESQFRIHRKAGYVWLSIMIAFYVVIFLLIYSSLKGITEIIPTRFDPETKKLLLFSNYAPVFIKIIIVSILTYALSFCRKNYNVERNLELKNRNRRTLAATLDRYLDSSQDIELKREMIQKTIPAFFNIDKTGYLDKESENLNPTQEVITNVIKQYLPDKK